MWDTDVSRIWFTKWVRGDSRHEDFTAGDVTNLFSRDYNNILLGTLWWSHGILHPFIVTFVQIPQNHVVYNYFTIGSTTRECYQWLRAIRAITHGYAERDGFEPHACIYNDLAPLG